MRFAAEAVLLQGFGRIRYIVLDRFFQAGRSQPKIRVHSFEICHCQESLFGDVI